MKIISFFASEAFGHNIFKQIFAPKVWTKLLQSYFLRQDHVGYNECHFESISSLSKKASTKDEEEKEKGTRRRRRRRRKRRGRRRRRIWRRRMMWRRRRSRKGTRRSRGREMRNNS